MALGVETFGMSSANTLPLVIFLTESSSDGGASMREGENSLVCLLIIQVKQQRYNYKLEVK